MKKQLRFIILLPLVFLFTPSAYNQAALSLEDAIQQGLEKNYAIRIARNQEIIADNSNNPGNAGMLPTISATGNFSYTSNNTRQEFFSGDLREGQGAGNTSVRGGLALTWTAFDGFRMFAVRDRLELQATRSRTFTESAMQDLVTQIQTAYYGLVRLRQQIYITVLAFTVNHAI